MTHPHDMLTNEERLSALFNELDKLLNMAPCVDDCSDKENLVYAKMADLKEALFDAGCYRLPNR